MYFSFVCKCGHQCYLWAWPCLISAPVPKFVQLCLNPCTRVKARSANSFYRRIKLRLLGWITRPDIPHNFRARDKLYVVQKRWPAGFEVIKLWNARPGRERFLSLLSWPQKRQQQQFDDRRDLDAYLIAQKKMPAETMLTREASEANESFNEVSKV